MHKSLQIKLSKIGYRRDSIGDDVRVEIYNTLMKARKGDFTSIGVLEVID